MKNSAAFANLALKQSGQASKPFLRRVLAVLPFCRSISVSCHAWERTIWEQLLGT